MASGGVRVHSSVCCGPSTCAVLSLSPLRPFALPLSSAGSGLSTVCTPRAFGVDVHLDSF
jgi:hypothetical protein